MTNDRDIYRQRLKEYSMKDNLDYLSKFDEVDEVIENQEEYEDNNMFFNKKYIFIVILILVVVCILISLFFIYKNNNKWNKLLDYLNENSSIEYTNKDTSNNYTVSMKPNGDNIIIRYNNDIIVDNNAYYKVSLSTSISKDSSLIDINCNSNTKIYFISQYEEGTIKLDISNYVKNVNNNIDVTFSNYKIWGKKIDGSTVDPNTTGGMLNIKKDEFIYQMIYGTNEIIKKINDNGLKIEIKDIGFINYEK